MSFFAGVVGKITLPAQSQIWIWVQTALSGTATLQSYKPLYEKTFAAVSNGVVFVETNVKFRILIAYKRNRDQKLGKNRKLSTMMSHAPITIIIAICVAKLQR